MSLNQTERAVVLGVIRRLSREAPLASDLKPHLEALRIYLDTWVIPPLEIIANPERGTYALTLAKGLVT